MNTIYTVRQLTDRLRRNLEQAFPFVWVRGEVSNVARPASGHVYFSLKDQDALLQCVWFRGQQRGEELFDPLTGEVFENGPRPGLAQCMENGQQILCAGRITVYAPRGACQMVVELAQDAGQGRLAEAFAALKLRLEAKGYFAPERKRPLPNNPQRVAIVTAPTGAVIHDFIRIAATRGCGASLRLHPVPVQGNGAAAAIAAALREVNAQGWAQVVALLRGGGSLEDLWAFNEEIVADAVFASAIPVIAGIGHEVDTSMADMTADVRAATPSHAAQLLWPARGELEQRVDGAELALQTAGARFLTDRASTLGRMEQALHWLSPVRALQNKEARFALCAERLHRAGERLLADRESVVQRLQERLARSMALRPQALGARLENLTVRLEAASPLAPLERGYALVRHTRGGVLRSVEEAAVGGDVEIVVRDGSVAARVTGVNKGKRI